jgi:uncharacterized protein (DUF1330 family)
MGPVLALILSFSIWRLLHQESHHRRSTMPAYAVFIRESTRDPSELGIYGDKVGATLEGHPVKVLAAYGDQEVLEGPKVEGVVILEFPTLAAAKAWYDSPAYRETRAHRFRGADYRAVIVEGL